MTTPTHYYSVVVIGGGQAGLSMSYRLKQTGIDHIVYERDCIFSAWRKERWDTFCLVTPNYQCNLPDFPYTGEDPHGFMLKDEIVDYVLGFARKFDPPVREGVEVRRVTPEGAGFVVETSEGTVRAGQVVVATGAYHFPRIPACAKTLPSHVFQIHSRDYKRPSDLPPGEVLVVGSGQSGCQIVEDLHLAGRKTHFCIGEAPRSPRSYRGQDAVRWLEEMGHYDIGIDTYADPDAVRVKTNHYLTGRDGGREIDLRQFALEGVRLYGSLRNIEGTALTIAGNLRACLDSADEVYCGIRKLIDEHIEKNRIEAPLESPFVKKWEPEREISTLDLRDAGITSIVWASGFGCDFGYIEADVFDDRGYPRYHRGVTAHSGLYFIGLPWLHTWGSGRLQGMARDSAYLLDHIVALGKRAAGRLRNAADHAAVHA